MPEIDVPKGRYDHVADNEPLPQIEPATILRHFNDGVKAEVIMDGAGTGRSCVMIGAIQLTGWQENAGYTKPYAAGFNSAADLAQLSDVDNDPEDAFVDVKDRLRYGYRQSSIGRVRVRRQDLKEGVEEIERLRAEVEALRDDAERFRAIHAGRIKLFGWNHEYSHFGGEFWPTPATPDRWGANADPEIVAQEQQNNANGRDVLLCYADVCRGKSPDKEAAARIEARVAESSRKWEEKRAREAAEKVDG